MLKTNNISIELFLKDIRLSITELLNIFLFSWVGGGVDRLSPHLHMQIYWSWKALCKNRPKTFWGCRGYEISWGFGNSTIYLRFVSKENLEGYLIIEMKIVHLLPPLVSHQIRYDRTATGFTKGGKTWSKLWNPSKFSLETNLRYMVIFPKPQDIA